jgi:serine phosphatase RsbU (regulator of sigma subunit)
VQQESLDFYQGIIILLMAAAVIYFVKRNVTKRFLETYILQMRIKENSDQMKKELELATRVHRRLVPHSFSGKLADIGVSYVPMTYMGGDYAQFRFIDKNKLLFIIADVTGHGVPAALLVNALNAEFERASMEGKNPGEMLKEMDDFIKKDFAETGMYLTAFCGLLDYRGRRFLYSNYGHPPQYVYLAKKHNIMEIYAQTSFLGLPFSDESIYEDQIKFDRGDQIVLFTDGVLEARDRNKEEFGPRRLKRFILDNHVFSAEEFNHELLKRLSSFTGDKYNDDIFILNIHTK